MSPEVMRHANRAKHLLGTCCVHRTNLNSACVQQAYVQSCEVVNHPYVHVTDPDMELRELNFVPWSDRGKLGSEPQGQGQLLGRAVLLLPLT